MRAVAEREHILSKDCWCRPEVLNYEEGQVIKGDGKGGITTTVQSQDHTEWPCVEHKPDVSCRDAIAAYAAKRGVEVILDVEEPKRP